MNCSYSLNNALSVRKVDEEIFILDRSTNVLHSFNGTGAFIWERLQRSDQLDDIAAAVAADYEVTPEQVREDVFDFLLTLEKAHLLTVTCQ